MEYKFIINDFEGPLDLLLHLIKTSKMDIYDIKINEITKQYIDFIDKMKELNLTIASEYLVMASELTLIKSKMLIPRNDIELEEEDPRENLVNRLVEYQKYKEMIEDFKILEQERKDIFTKEPINLKDITDEKVKNDGEITLDDLMKALETFLKRKEYEKPLETKITKKELLVSERTKEIKDILKTKKRVSFFELFKIKTKEYIVVTFLSILEMAKLGELKITQENNFNNIIVSEREGA